MLLAVAQRTVCFSELERETIELCVPCLFLELCYGFVVVVVCIMSVGVESSQLIIYSVVLTDDRPMQIILNGCAHHRCARMIVSKTFSCDHVCRPWTAVYDLFPVH